LPTMRRERKHGASQTGEQTGHAKFEGWGTKPDVNFCMECGKPCVWIYCKKCWEKRK
jgi:hypothetical protein